MSAFWPLADMRFHAAMPLMTQRGRIQSCPPVRGRDALVDPDGGRPMSVYDLSGQGNRAENVHQAGGPPIQ
jgi:hypothetical protein